MEQLGYIATASKIPLYAVYHPAESSTAEMPLRAHYERDGVPVLIAPSLFEERKSAYGSLRHLATRLAAAGHPVLRFDYRGSGESGGNPALRRWEDLGTDLESTRHELAQRCGRQDVALLGLRLGGTLVLQQAARLKASAVIVVSPVIKGAAQVRLWKMRSKIRAELTNVQGAPDPVKRPTGGAQATPFAGLLDFDGFDVNPSFFDEVARIDLLQECRPLPCPTLLLQVSHRTGPAEESRQFQAVLGANATLQCLRLEPFWDKIDDVDTHEVEEAVLKALP